MDQPTSSSETGDHAVSVRPGRLSNAESAKCHQPSGKTLPLSCIHRAVVAWKGVVMELEDSGASGRIRTSGAGGPMSGELVATVKDNVSSRPLEEGEVRMLDLALANARQ